MKENKYDNEQFFKKYEMMERSKKGLEGAGEWHELKKILPDFKGKTVLDLGCGYGWHCAYAIKQGADYVLGVDIIISSLAFHYIKDFAGLVEKIVMWLKENGEFVFSVEHPVFTSYGSQDWYYDENGNILHFPVDNYYYEGKREAVFLGEKVIKYHRTLTTYLNCLLSKGFELKHVIEPQPSPEMIELPGMKDEMRRPMMLLVSAKKK